MEIIYHCEEINGYVFATPALQHLKEDESIIPLDECVAHYLGECESKMKLTWLRQMERVFIKELTA